jgi:hypothetical protein
MAGKVYFGNAQKQTWIVSPQSGMRASSAGYVSEQQLLSGSTSIKRSGASHRRFEASWLGSLNAPELEDSLQTVKEFADGYYGHGPFFWNDPYAMKSNLLAPAWASPAMSIDSDWYAICPDDVGVQKEKVLTSSISSLVGNNTQNYPLYAAKFTAPGNPTLQSDKFTFYIPDGYTLWIGLHGHHGTTGKAYIKPYNNGTAGTAVELTPLAVSTATRFSTSISSTVADKAEFYLAKVASGQCVFHIVGIIAQLLPTGQTPATGEFLSGRGTTGLEFASFPTMEYYSANVNDGQIGMSATLVEV